MLDCDVTYILNLLLMKNMNLLIKFKVAFMAGQFQRMFVSCGGNGGGIPKICGRTRCLFGKPGVTCVRRWVCVPEGKGCGLFFGGGGFCEGVGMRRGVSGWNPVVLWKSVWCKRGLQEVCHD